MDSVLSAAAGQKRILGSEISVSVAKPRKKFGIFTTWSHRAGAGKAEALLLSPRPVTAQIAYEWGVIGEVVANGKALARARELATLYLKAPEVTRRNTRAHFIQPLKERIVREVGYGLSVEGASAAALVKSMQAARS